MKRALFAVCVALAAAAAYWAQPERGSPVADYPPATGAPASSAPTPDRVLARAFAERRSDLQVMADGVVMKTLPDDERGSRHQRFIVELASGQTVLVAHNIDLAGRIEALRSGDRVSVYGEYEWNPRGGVIHWTHRDARGTHVGGWIKHQGRMYQ